MTETVAIDQVTEERRVAGTVGVVVAIGLAVVLGIHPPADTALYDDPIEFVDHVGLYWILLHLAAAVLFLALPVAVIAWADTLQSPAARVVGRICGTVSIVGVAIGVVHLVGTDAITFEFFADTLDSGAPAAETVADGLLRLHAATLTSFMVTLFFGVPLFAAAASWLDGRRDWHCWLPAAAVVLVVASLAVTISERQYTTLSEMGLFRPGATLLIIWLFLVGRELRAT
jgi:hypothetical protein